MFKSKKTISLALALLAFVFVLGSFFFPKKYLLTVRALPEDATIVVEGVSSAKSVFNQKLVPGNYTIFVSKEGFEPYQELVGLAANTSLSVALNQSQSLTSLSRASNIVQGSLVNTTTQGGLILGIDPLTGALTNRTGGGKLVVSAGPIKDYGLAAPLVAILKNQDSETIEVIDTKTSAARLLAVSGYGPVISVSLSADKKQLFFLGKYDSKTNAATLFETPLSPFAPKPIVESRANLVRALSGGAVLLITESETQDNGLFVIYDYLKKDEVASAKGNTASLSPGAKSVAVASSRTLWLVDVTTKTKRSTAIAPAAKIGWLGEEWLAAFINKRPGVEIYKINAKTLATGPTTSPPELGNTSVLEVEPLDTGTLLVLDREGRAWKVLIGGNPSPGSP